MSGPEDQADDGEQDQRLDRQLAKLGAMESPRHQHDRHEKDVGRKMRRRCGYEGGEKVPTDHQPDHARRHEAEENPTS